MIYVRWREGASRRSRVFDSAGQIGGLPCPQCGLPLHLLLPIQLIAVGPDDARTRSEHAAGKWFACAAVALHKSCADDLDDDRLEILISELEVVGPDG
jgi:hypothetical protein